MVFTTEEEEVLKLIIADVSARARHMAVRDFDIVKNKVLADEMVSAANALKAKFKV